MRFRALAVTEITCKGLNAYKVVSDSLLTGFLILVRCLQSLVLMFVLLQS